MRVTKRQLRGLIREKHWHLQETHDEMHAGQPGWGISPNPEFGGAPCPHETATAIKESGASDSDILDWLHALTMDLTSGGEVLPEEEFSFTEDVVELPGENVFNTGYDAGKRGLE